MLADKSHVGDTSEHSEVKFCEILNINLFEKVNVANDVVLSTQLTDFAPIPSRRGLVPTYPVKPTYGMVYVEMRKLTLLAYGSKGGFNFLPNALSMVSAHVALLTSSCTRGNAYFPRTCLIALRPTQCQSHPPPSISTLLYY